MLGIEVVRIVDNIGLGDEVAAGTPFDTKIDAARIADPAWLEGGDGRIDGELRRDGQRHLRADAAAKPDRAIATRALAIGDDMRIGRRQRANPAAGLFDFRILVPVVVARDEVDRVDAVRVKEDFAETGAVERAVVGMRTRKSRRSRRWHAAARPFTSSSGLLKISLEVGGGTDKDAGARSMLARQFHTGQQIPRRLWPKWARRKKLYRDAIRTDSRLDAIGEPVSQG